MIKPRILTLVFCLLFPVSVLAQTSAANRSWDAYWAKFSAAVNSKNKTAVKSLMASEKDFLSAGGETRNQWLASVQWAELRKSVRKGTKTETFDGRPGRISRD